MNKFFLKIFLFIILALSLILAISILVTYLSFYVNDNSYFKSVYDKHQRLSNLKSPKIIITGGSGCAYGINSKKIEDSTGYNTVNMGVHADFDYRYMLNEIKNSISKNDIVIFIPEYDLAAGDGNGDHELYDMLSCNPQSFRYLEFRQYLNFFSFFGKTTLINFRKIFKHPDTDRIYYRSAFNKEGDLISHLNRRSLFIDCNFIKGTCNPIYANSFIRFITNFHEFCNSKKAILLYSFPAIAQSTFDSVNANILYDKLRGNKINLIDKPIDYVYCDTLFFNTNYHLTSYGREMRTDKLVKNLRLFIKKNCN